jgi:multiple sugar transport system permease protein
MIASRVEAVAAARPRGRRWTNVFERQGVFASALISPAVVFVLALVGGPLVLAIALSFTNATAGQLHGKWVGLENFRNEWSNPSFQHAVWHTFLFTVISQAVVLLVAGFLAHALIRKFPGRWLLRFLILLPWAAPIALSLMAWKWMFDTSYSILNWTLVHLHLSEPLDVPQYLAQPKLAMGSVVAVHAWRIIPFAVVIFLAGLASIPKEVDDAAAIDGATGFRKFWSVTLPLQLPIATVALLFGIVFTATDMAVVFILTQGGPPPSFSTEMITTWAYKTGVESGSLGPGAAISIFLLPVLAVVSIAMLMFARRTEVA